MNKVDDPVMYEILKREQARRRDETEKQRKAVVERKIETRRCIILGELLIEAFPEVVYFELHRTEAANTIEFAPLKKLFKKLFTDENLIARIKHETGWDSLKFEQDSNIPPVT